MLRNLHQHGARALGLDRFFVRLAEGHLLVLGPRREPWRIPLIISTERVRPIAGGGLGCSVLLRCIADGAMAAAPEPKNNGTQAPPVNSQGSPPGTGSVTTRRADGGGAK